MQNRRSHPYNRGGNNRPPRDGPVKDHSGNDSR